MTPYGAKKQDMRDCGYGCCGSDLRRSLRRGTRADKKRRAAGKRACRRARNEGKREIYRETTK